MSVFIRLLFFLGDLLLLNIAVVLSFMIGSEVEQLSDKVYLFIFSNLSWIYLSLVSNPYNLDKAWILSKAIKMQLAFLFIHLIVVASLIFFLKRSYSVYQVGFIYLFFIPLFFVWKIATYYLRKFFVTELNTKNFVLVGRNIISNDVRKYYLLNPDLGYRFVGYIDTIHSGEEIVQRIRELNTSNEIHEVFCCTMDLSNVALTPLINFGLDSLIKVRIVFNTETHQQTIQLDRHDQGLKQNVSVVVLDESMNRMIKRVFDLAFSFFFLLLVMSWLLPIVGILIRLDSKGSIFFIQKRNGEGNKPFGCIKFRTMFVNSEAEFKQAVKGDARITKLGKFLRKSSIDELPQFINVFRGDMSLIGPRPHPIKLNEQFAPLISSLMSRHYVKPGITGLAQCMGYRGETQTLADMENRVRLDRYYIENWTFWLDIKIIFLTVVSLIRGSDKAF